MSYDPKKYKEKRDKVLGIKKRGLGFGTLVIIVSVCIIGGLGIAGLPQAVAYLTTRNLDDAIFKLDNASPWSDAVMTDLRAVPGVTRVETDKHSTRLVVTFDRTQVELSRLTTVFNTAGLRPTLLNRLDHRQRLTIQKHEEMLE
ncbi:MAG: hypothetical protein V1793_20335 [Pseudomonadota bacterium]